MKTMLTGKLRNKFRAEVNKVETKGNIQRINKNRSCYFEKINKINKPLARLIRGHRDSVQVNKIRNEKEETSTEIGLFKTSSDPTTKAYTQQNWKIWMKCTIF
jgi:CRISPR/Cas system-associated endoribonuclease Cas2